VSERDPRRWVRFAASAGALVTLAVAVPAGLVAVSRSRFGSANPLAGADPPWRWASGGVGDTLSGPIADDTVIDGIIRASLCVVWVAVAIIVVTTVVEVVHALRYHGLAFPDVHGVRWAQSIARFIAVGLIAVVPMMTPATSLASTLGARSAATAPFHESIDAEASTTPSLASERASVPPSPSPAQETVVAVHVVTPGESIYSIAVDLAGGDSARVLEIADAIIDTNLGSVMPSGQRFTNPAYIEVGWTLQVPADVAPQPLGGGRTTTEVDDAAVPASTYIVERGDTLWDIADEQLGDPTAWPEIWDQNAGDDMGGGRTFDDPNVILPGWELDLADTEPAVAPAVDARVDESSSSAAPPPVDAADAPANALADAPADSPVDAPADAPRVQPDWTPTDPAADIAAPSTDETVVNGPLPLTPPASTTPDSASTTTTTVGPATDPSGAGTDLPAVGSPAPEAPSPIRLEHAALLAAGVLALVGVRRRQRLRAAMPRHRVPEPRAEVAHTERKLRTIDAGERILRADVACRAAARSLIHTGSQIGWIEVSPDGDLELRLTAPAVLPLPWSGADQSWSLGAEVPVEMLGEDARQVGQPCVALVQLGLTSAGNELLVDLEACGVLSVIAQAAQADEVVTALATAVASSLFAEVAHLVAVSVPEQALLNHRSAHVVTSADAAVELACSLAGSTALNARSSFELRSLRTGGEMWEPAVVLLGSADDGSDVCGDGRLPDAGHGVAVVVADEHRRVGGAPATLVARSVGWQLDAFGTSIDVTPVGISATELDDIVALLVDADRGLEPDDPADEIRWADDIGDDIGTAIDDGERVDAEASQFEPRPHEIVVGLIGGVEVHARTGEPGNFERSKTVELIAWLTTHRDRATRSGARTALWDLDVRDATFANVVSEARRALARLVPPPDGEEWVARTLTEQLPVHDLVVTDAELVEDRLAHARVQPPSQAIETLRPAVELVRDMPFAGTSYLWPDAEGITSNLVLLAITATAEFAGHALSLGDTDGVFWATGKGLRVLPGHEELIALRMQAHARAGDLAGVRQEWESYERVLVADAWSDGEPAPKLLALRHELLSPSTS
jgi:nucleoid-associated protein YgaU/two-component SAPR family response regulator